MRGGLRLRRLMPAPTPGLGLLRASPGAAAGTITPDAERSTPTGLLSAADNFPVGPSTLVLGGSGSWLPGSLMSVNPDDVVAGASVTGASLTRHLERRARRLLRPERSRRQCHHRHHGNHTK